MTTRDDLDDLMAAVRQGRLRVGPRTRAIALVLHGGRSVTPQPRRHRDVSYLRMLPFAPAVARASRGSIAPVLVHNRHGGWIASSGTGLVQTREIVRRRGGRARPARRAARSLQRWLGGAARRWPGRGHRQRGSRPVGG
uniref:Uncharacterized protein n=1 Tax=Janibacter limosus TaxID=53458 RepID=A0AC61U7F3_9MICO|nr:hypothetical protein [Janibacter limosus]